MEELFGIQARQQYIWLLLALEVGYVLGGGCTILPSYGSSKAVMRVNQVACFFFWQILTCLIIYLLT